MPSFRFNLLLRLTLLVNHFERCDEFRCDLFPLSKFYWLLKLSARRFEICNVSFVFVTQGAVTLSLQYSKTPHGIQRKKSLSEKGVFGVDIATVSR